MATTHTVTVTVVSKSNGALKVCVDNFRLEVAAGDTVIFVCDYPNGQLELDKKGLNRGPWGKGKPPKKGPSPSIVAKHTHARSSDHEYEYDIIAHYIDVNGAAKSIKIDPVMIIK